MTLADLNAMTEAEADAAVRVCVDVDRWVAAVVDGRPWSSDGALLATAATIAATWTDAEVDHALRDHPRIGERPTGTGATAEHSRGEQAGMDTAGADLAARMADGNRRYEERFGRIYLVRAAGRSADELLAILERRLGNDDVTERRETREQLAEIALLRLRGLVGRTP